MIRIWNRYIGFIESILVRIFFSRARVYTYIINKPGKKGLSNDPADQILHSPQSVFKMIFDAFVRRKVLLLCLLIILVGIPLAISKFFHQKKAEAAWFDDNWIYRQRVDITNSGSAQTDFQVGITLNTSTLISAGKMQSDCDDIRITDANGKLLPHWIEENNPGCNQTTTKIWTKIPSISTTGNTLYVYYGNPSVSNIEKGGDVFSFFDDFNSSAVNQEKWYIASGTTYSLSGGVLQITLGSFGLQNALSFDMASGYIAESRARFDNLENAYGGVLETSSSQFNAGGNGNADATILYMRETGNSRDVKA